MVRVVKTKVEIEGKVHEETVVVERDEPSTWEAGRKFKQVGQSAKRVDGRERVTGAARYTFDIQPAGLLSCAVLRSPHAHARVLSLDTSKAKALPGVRAVVSASNVPDIPWYGGASKLFGDEVRFIGEEIAAVAADDLDTARDALALIEVEYEVLPFVVDMEEAAKPGAPQIHPKGNVLRNDEGQEGELYTRGDVTKGFKSADVIVEGTYRTPTALHNSFETHGSVAMWEGDELVIWESTQYIFGVRSRVASALDMPLSKIRVISEYMGGGFGSKGSTLKSPVIAALLSKATGRPVKLMLDRHEENLLAGNRGATVQKLKLGAKKDGTLVAIDLEALYGMGAYGMWAGSVDGPAKELYSCPNVRTHVVGVRTNLGTHAAFRAPGFVEGTFALETAIDELCAKLGIDPLIFRRKNFTQKDPVTGHAYTSKPLLECYDKALELLGKSPGGKLNEPASSRLAVTPWKRGTGLASQIWSGGGGPPAHAQVRLNPDGTIEVMCGTQDIGTGTKTSLSQIVAEELGVPLESVRFRLGDTQKGPYAPASWGSITVPSVGPAVRAAAQDAKEQLLEIASFFMEVPAQLLQIADGAVTIEGRPESRRSIQEVLSEIGDYMITGKGFRGPNPTNPLRTWGAQIAEVMVNINTGEVRVLRIAAVHDVGRVINPMGLSSQFYGGILQGLGFGLTEERIVDGRDGSVLNGNLQDYKVPTNADTPEMLVCGLDKPDTEANHIGSKGAGEPPIIPTAAAIVNAIYSATGVMIKDLPVTRRRMLEALGESRRRTARMNNFSYVRADSPEDAQRQSGSGIGVRILAGGTDLIPLIKDRIIAPEGLVDISGWSHAASIDETEDGLLIGALTPLSRLGSDQRVFGGYKALADACNLAATPQLRNMGTLAGNLLQQTRCWYYRGHHNCWMKGGQFCYARDGENENHSIFMTGPSESKCVSAHPSDPGAALLALDATILMLTSTGRIDLPIADFFALPTDERRTYTNLPDGALITSIRLPRRGQDHRSSYTKAMARASWAFALAGVALSIDIDGTTIKDARVALTGVGPIPFRASKLEHQISGTELGELDYEDLAALLVEDAAPLAHNAYKVDLLGALFKQAVADLLK